MRAAQRAASPLRAAPAVALSGAPAPGISEPALDSLEDPRVTIQGLDDREADTPDVLERSPRVAHQLLDSLVRLQPLLPAFLVGAPALLVSAPALFVSASAIGIGP